VKVVQGDTTMRCKTLVVFYEQQSKDGQQALAAAQTMPAAKPGPGGSSQISKLEAGGGVTVTQKDQTATGDRALFDMRSNTVTLLGNVVVSQGPNVMRGEKLVVDLTTGVSRVEAGKGPVRMLIQQGPPQEKGGAALPKFGPQRPSSNSTN
jgi:lipopolysaccharide export system protein LptA